MDEHETLEAPRNRAELETHLEHWHWFHDRDWSTESIVSLADLHKRDHERSRQSQVYSHDHGGAELSYGEPGTRLGQPTKPRTRDHPHSREAMMAHLVYLHGLMRAPQDDQALEEMHRVAHDRGVVVKGHEHRHRARAVPSVSFPARGWVVLVKDDDGWRTHGSGQLHTSEEDAREEARSVEPWWWTMIGEVDLRGNDWPTL